MLLNGSGLAVASTVDIVHASGGEIEVRLEASKGRVESDVVSSDPGYSHSKQPAGQGNMPSDGAMLHWEPGSIRVCAIPRSGAGKDAG